MKTDTIFYSLFQEFPSFFFELIDRPPDEATPYRPLVKVKNSPPSVPPYQGGKQEKLGSLPLLRGGLGRGFNEQMLQFQELLTSRRVQRIYLDELPETADRSLGVKVVKLVIEPE